MLPRRVLTVLFVMPTGLPGRITTDVAPEASSVVRPDPATLHPEGV